MGCTSSKNLEENATDIAPGRNVRQRSLLVPILSIPSHKSMTRLFQHEENKRPISINNNEPKKLETFQFNYNKFSSSPNSTQKPLKYVNSFKRINSHSILSNSYRIKQSMTTPRSVLVHSKHLSSSDHNYSETSNKLPIVSISPEFSNRASDYRDFNTKLSNKERTPDISMTPDVLSMKSNYFSGKTSCNIKGVVYPSDYIITPIDDNILDKSITSSVNNKSFIGSFPPYEAPPTLLRTPTISNSCVELSVNGKCVNVTVEDYGHTDFNEDDEYLDNTEDQLISIEDDAMLGSTASTTITNVSISNETQGINSLSNSLTHSNSNAPNFLNSLRHYEDIRNNLHRAKSFAIRSRTSTLNGCDDCDSPPKVNLTSNSILSSYIILFFFYLLPIDRFSWKLLYSHYLLTYMTNQ